jgi:hypothetical protein
MKQLICFILGCLFLLTEGEFTLWAQQKKEAKLHNCITQTVNYNSEGKIQTGTLLIVNFRDSLEPALLFANIYLLGPDGQNRLLCSKDSGLYNVYFALVSPDSKYLAVYTVGEGHPWIDIYDLQLLISEGKILALGGIQPYPGNVDMIKWKGKALMVESDIDLMKKNQDKELLFEDIGNKRIVYFYDVETHKFWKK